MTDFSELTRGPAWEYRVQRALFLSGWYTRRGINLRERVQGSPQTMAEVDVLGLGFDPSLSPRSMVGECKDRKGSTKEADRIVWLLGLAKLLRADHVLFAKTTLSTATVQFAKPAGVALWDQAAVRETEQRFHLEVDSGFFGSCNISLQEEVLKPSRKANAIKDKHLKAAWEYLSGAFWYSGTPARTKRLKAYFEALQGARGIDGRAKSAFVAEGLIALLISGYTSAGQLARLSPGFGVSQQESAFSSGAADARALREIAARADDYYQNALQQALAGGSGKGAAGAKVPRLANAVAETPEWMPAYLAFSRRLGERPLMAGDVLRYSDVILFEELLAGEEVEGILSMVFAGSLSEMQTLLELGALFLKRVWGIEDALLEAVLGRPAAKRSARKSAPPPRRHAQVPGDKLFD